MQKIIIITVMLMAALARPASAQTSPKPIEPLAAGNPWTDEQLIEPITLARVIKTGYTGGMVIYNIGAVGDIKDARHIGPVSKPENLEKLNAEIARLPKNTAIIIYCGCCPFAKCPNVRPAFEQLTKAGFTHVRILDLPQNLQINWVAKSYPMPADDAGKN